MKTTMTSVAVALVVTILAIALMFEVVAMGEGTEVEYIRTAEASVEIPEVVLPPKETVEIADYSDIKRGTHGGQCVEFIKEYLQTYTTNPNFRGHARDIIPNSDVPEVGAAVLTNEPTGHAALVIAIMGDELVLAESNYRLDERITLGRTLKVGDPRIRGYYTFN
jgi:hypothetical protein